MDITRNISVLNKDSWMRKKVGKARDVRQWQENWVSGSDFAGYTQHRDGKQKFWLVGDGFEEEIHSTIRVREGHEVAAVWVGKNKSSGSLALLYNTTTGEHAWSLNSKSRAKQEKTGVRLLSWFFLLVAVVYISIDKVLGNTKVDGVDAGMTGAVSLCLYLWLLFIIFLEKQYWDKLAEQALIFAKENS